MKNANAEKKRVGIFSLITEKSFGQTDRLREDI